MPFIDCNEQNAAGKTTWPENPHCDHGMWLSDGSVWRSPTYKAWTSILMRTRYWNEANSERHAKYRGIEVEWDTFQDFRAAMGPKPSREHTIDRIDPDKGYTTKNCQWLLAHLNYSKGGRQAARQSSAAMIDRMQAELEDLENELKEEGIRVE